MAPGKLSANENRLKHGAGVRGKPFRPNLFLSPDQNTPAKPAGLNETLHEIDLIDAGGQEGGSIRPTLSPRSTTVSFMSTLMSGYCVFRNQ